MKYIVTNQNSFALFTLSETHSHIARGMEGKVIGAGFATIAVGYKNPSEYLPGDENRILNVHCYGQSISLGISGDKEHDENLINRLLNRTY